MAAADSVADIIIIMVGADVTIKAARDKVVDKIKVIADSKVADKDKTRANERWLYSSAS